MSKGLLFWVIWVLCLLFGVGWNRGLVGPWGPYGFGFIVLILLFLLGWHDFGFVVQ